MSLLSDEKLKEAFDTIDEDGSGRITPTELQQLFDVGGHDVSLAACTLLIGLFDEGEGSIDFDGFSSLWYLFGMWSTIFKSYDLDGSGFLEKRELRIACDQAFQRQYEFTDAYIDKLIQKFGQTKPGVLTSDEYLIAFAYVKNSPPPKRPAPKQLSVN